MLRSAFETQRLFPRVLCGSLELWGAVPQQCFCIKNSVLLDDCVFQTWFLSLSPLTFGAG